MKLWLAILPAILTLNACQKGFLEVRPDKALLVPTTLADFRALLDNYNVFNRSPGMTAIADGDLYTTDAGFRAFILDAERNSYIWAKDIYGDQAVTEWNDCFQQVFYANVVLDGVAGLPTDQNIPERNAVEGTARFHRAWIYYHTAEMFCKPFNTATASTDLGLPLRTSADVNRTYPRATLGDTYNFILEDLKRARNLLPQATTYKNRPGMPALYGFLAKVYLSRGEFDKAGAYADSALRLSPALLDFNTLNATATRPMPQALPNNNAEIYFYSSSISGTFSGSTAIAYIEPALYASYVTNDLRRTCLFRDQGAGRVNFKGSYTGAFAWFNGLTAGEMFLIRAECAARSGNVTGAIADLNTLLAKRWRNGTFAPLSAADPETALRMVLVERRKELVGRTARWSDLRRLNSDPRFAETSTRIIDGVTYTLEPGSRRYTYPIPDSEIQYTGLEQNER